MIVPSDEDDDEERENVEESAIVFTVHFDDSQQLSFDELDDDDVF